MMVMITMTPARVRPDWEVTRLRGLVVSRCSIGRSPRDRATPQPRNRDSPALVRGAIESIAGGLTVYVVDAGGGVVGSRCRIGRHRVRIGGIGSVLHLFPVGLAGHRVLGDVAQIVLLLERLQALGIFLLVGVVVVDRF